MKIKSFILAIVVLSGLSFHGSSQQTASGYLLFGKNKTESGAVCTQTGICRLQQLDDAEMVGVSFTATPIGSSTTDYSLSITFNIDDLLAKQPDQAEYFVDAKVPYMVTDKFIVPKWLIASLGFDTGKNKYVTFLPPFSLGIPVADSKGMVTLTFESTLKIVR